jgi:hypothetical protein
MDWSYESHDEDVCNDGFADGGPVEVARMHGLDLLEALATEVVGPRVVEVQGLVRLQEDLPAGE